MHIYTYIIQILCLNLFGLETNTLKWYKMNQNIVPYKYDQAWTIWLYNFSLLKEEKKN